MEYAVRPVESLPELAAVFDLLGSQFASAFGHDDRRFTDLARRFPADRTLMLVVEHEHDGVVGGALAFRPGEGESDWSGVLLRVIALAPTHRGRGLGRLLVERIESEAAKLGAVSIHLGADQDSRGFYLRLGYTGRSRMHKALAGAGVHRYGQVDDRRRRLEELRARRSERSGSSSP